MIRAAVVGCGRMGAGPSSRLAGQVPAGWLPSAHTEALRHVPGVDLVALCDTNPGTLQRAAAMSGVTRTYADFRELIAGERPDLLSIATRTPEKADIMLAAIAGGVRALYVEKPLATTVAGARALLETAARANVAVSYGVNRRFHSAYRHARALIAQGVIGELRDITVEFGRSLLLWTHPHSVDLLLWFAGDHRVDRVHAVLDPETVTRTSDLVVDSDPILEHAWFQFTSGVCGTILRSGGHGVRLAGTDGQLAVHANGECVTVHRRTNPSSPYFTEIDITSVPAPESATVTAMRELAAVVANGGSPGIEAVEIVTGLQMLFGCVWSHLHCGAVVGVDRVPEQLLVSGRSGHLYA